MYDYAGQIATLHFHAHMVIIPYLLCWREADLSSIIEPRLQDFSDAKSLILDVCSREDRKDTEHFAMMDWFAAQDNHEKNASNQISVVWSPPAEGWVKCNADAGFNRTYRSTNRGCMSSIEAETLALKEVIQHVVTMNLDLVIFESDSQVVIQGIHSTATGSSEFNFILLSIKCLLDFIPNFEVKFIKRQPIMVTDSLVKAANSLSRRSIVNVIPPCIDFHLINNMS
ncbi:uncharacterized protein LOC131651865 [Vicia villosa]|uniref:uncharacterized protein LOC131651865 n=1 Tax=Vicia villosa TaxID=3911 RepID=UPI00273B6126|nr:uncharacterized protein LOC131651865 [Vicia villosa]